MPLVLEEHISSKKMEIKGGDKFFSRIPSKEATSRQDNESSFRVYYGANGASVPFTWESQPGTPKHTLFSDYSVIPPLTPPPSYYAKKTQQEKASAEGGRSGGGNIVNGSSKPKIYHLLLQTAGLPNLLQRSISSVSPSASSSHSSVSSSRGSLTSSSSSMSVSSESSSSTLYSPTSVSQRPRRQQRRRSSHDTGTTPPSANKVQLSQLFDADMDDHVDEGPKSSTTTCFRRRHPAAASNVVKNALFSIVSCHSRSNHAVDYVV